MLSPSELLEMKGRMLIASRVAGLLIHQDENSPLEIPEDQFPLVVDAMERLDQDVRAVLTEVDVLRGMVTGKFDFLGVLSNGLDKDVQRSGEEESGSDSVGEPADAGATDQPVGSSGTDRKAAKRSKPRRNTRRAKKDSEPVDGGAA